MRVRLISGAVGVLLMLPIACSKDQPPRSSAAPCSDLVPECTAERLPDVKLTGDETDGALAGTDGLDLDGIVSSDEALGRRPGGLPRRC